MEKAQVWQEMEMQPFHLYLFPLEPATPAEAQGFDLHQNFGRFFAHVLLFQKNVLYWQTAAADQRERHS